MANDLKLGPLTVNGATVVNGTTTLKDITVVSPNNDTRILDLQQFAASPATSSSFLTLKNSTNSVLGFIDYLANFQSGDGNAITPGHTFRNDIGIGMYRQGSGILAFSTSSTERMRISSGGLVGIGNTNPQDQLDVGTGNLRISNNGFLKLTDTQGTPNFVDIKAPATVGTTYQIVLPTGQGANNTVPVNDGSGNLSWQPVPVGATGDISQTTFAPANNQSSPANVTGLAFANASVRSATIYYSIVINATASLYESGTLQLIQKASSWDYNQETAGDASQLVFSVTAAGQVQYTTPNYTGFSSAKMQFRAIVTSV